KNYILKQINRDITLDTGSSSIIKGFYLYQNYPNPFNPNTVISWQSPVRRHITLKVYDILGREVATLVDEVKETGIHHYPFSIIHFPLPTSVYFYQLRAGNPSASSPKGQAGQVFVETKKMILAK
ncbi:MAG: T9SS type A sorting domain-containing protein, partial [Bacteroidetes bacterium]|nr:T9SS type A sorting domain-containing protein [Bacteroidota bacterium]